MYQKEQPLIRPERLFLSFGMPCSQIISRTVLPVSNSQTGFGRIMIVSDVAATSGADFGGTG
jgi:hypothetical protein